MFLLKYSVILRLDVYQRQLFFKRFQEFPRLLHQNAVPGKKHKIFSKTNEIERDKKTKFGQVDIKSKQKLKIENSTQNSVPLIVNMMLPQTNEVDLSEDLFQVELKSKLQDIRHDFRAHVNKAEKLSDADEQTRVSANSKEELQTKDIIKKDYIESICLDEKEDIVEEHDIQNTTDDKSLFGTPMPGTRISSVPCSGCGAYLHSENPIKPGYMKGKSFTSLTTDELKESICHRCHLIRNYNLCLDYKVEAEEYKKIISEVRSSNPLLIVMVDLLDIENSIFPKLLETVGRKQLFIVGNKVDLLPNDGPGYLNHVKNSLIDICCNLGLNNYNNIKHVALVSAKTGYGIEELITELMRFWGINGDVYLLGSTNTGKSTLFNTLLASDYCKSRIRDYINRATTSVWSGTTLSTLRFPIINPEPWRLYKRENRLEKQRAREALKEEERLRNMNQKESSGSYMESVLKANIKTTNFQTELKHELPNDELYDVGQNIAGIERTEGGHVITFEDEMDENEGKPSLSEFEEKFRNVKWLYDTPGVIQTSQIVNYLKPKEVLKITPKKRIIPRVCMLKPGQVLFISGLLRVDYTHGQQIINITTFTEFTLPMIIKQSYNADKFYNKQVGYPFLKVPINNADHLPSLIGREFEISGHGMRYSTADIQLSSFGWISVSVQRDHDIKLRVYTPGGRGCHLRQPSLIPNYRKFKGSKTKSQQCFEIVHPEYNK